MKRYKAFTINHNFDGEYDLAQELIQIVFDLSW